MQVGRFRRLAREESEFVGQTRKIRTTPGGNLRQRLLTDRNQGILSENREERDSDDSD
jgi:hypothetical protein